MLEDFVSKGQGDVSVHQKMIANLSQKLALLELPLHLQPLPSADNFPHSFVIPPADNGCWDVSLTDWLQFSQGLTVQDLADLQSCPVANPHSENAEYCAGFERRPTFDGLESVLYRHEDSPGLSACLFIISHPSFEKPVTIAVSSNFGDSRGYIVGDEIAALVQGKKIAHPLERVSESHRIYQDLIANEGNQQNLAHVMEMIEQQHIDPFPLALALAKNNKREIL